MEENGILTNLCQFPSPLPLQMRLVTSVAFRAIFHECFLSLLYFAGKCLHRRSKRREGGEDSRANKFRHIWGWKRREETKRGGCMPTPPSPSFPTLWSRTCPKKKLNIYNVVPCRGGFGGGAGFTHFRDGRHEEKNPYHLLGSFISMLFLRK